MKKIDPNHPAMVEIATPLGQMVRWTNHHFFSLMNQRAGVQMDRSSMAILNQVGVHGPLRISAIAQHLDLDPSTLSRQVAAAEQSGYVVRVADKSDARVNLVSATAKGLELHNRLIAAWRVIVAELFAEMPEDERKVLARALDRFVDKFIMLEQELRS